MKVCNRLFVHAASDLGRRPETPQQDTKVWPFFPSIIVGFLNGIDSRHIFGCICTIAREINPTTSTDTSQLQSGTPSSSDPESPVAFPDDLTD